MRRMIQVNLQTSLGGGEVYTAFVSRALDRLGIRTELVCHADAWFWNQLDLPGTLLRRPVADFAGVPAVLPQTPAWVLTHGPLPDAIAGEVAAHHCLTAIAHMPPQGRPKDRYAHCRMVFGVSAYVVAGLRALGVPVWEEPLYGVADLHRSKEDGAVYRASSYDWDMRKGRDRLLSWFEPAVAPLCYGRRRYIPRPGGITLGIVSRLTPIKQLPEMFHIIAPIIATHPRFNVEIFGAGGYASVRDLRRALRPLGSRVRFWGHQSAVGTIYRQIDYLLTGLPEKEALGLNVIESQACDTPVLAVDAPPFTETVVDGKTGYLYADPRGDAGASFSQLLDKLPDREARIHPAALSQHLERFSFDAFVTRMGSVARHIESASEWKL